MSSQFHAVRLASLVREFARLVVPVECPGCGRPDVVCCARCAAPLAAWPRRVEGLAPRLDRYDDAVLPVWAVAQYTGPVRGLVVAWKDRGRADLDSVIAGAARQAGAAVAAALGDLRAGAVVVVPAPSSSAAVRARGRDPVRDLADAVARGLRDAGVDARLQPALTQRGRSEQVGRGARARGRRLGAVRLRGGWRGLDGSPCLLVDDVLTTGATLAACEDALEGGGIPVLGGLVVAVTPPPRGRAEDLVSPRTGPFT